MQVIRYPDKNLWTELLKRPAIDFKEIQKQVLTIIDSVKKDGDNALRLFTERFDKVKLNSIEVSQNEIDQAKDSLDQNLFNAIKLAKNNIQKFHETQKIESQPVETIPGVTCWRKQVPIEKVGLYIPGGTAPLFSSVLMLGIPAKIAGCAEIILCTPPDVNNRIHPAILFCSSLIGINKIFRVGGAQAIAAMAYGTETIPKVYKIFGPGNQYVTAAKQIVSLDGLAIDLPAGPSEVAVMADKFADPQFVASDLLAQAEHGTDSQVILVTNSSSLIVDVQNSLDKQLANLPRKDIATQALDQSKIFLVENLDIGLDLINMYAPEHLILNTQNADRIVEKVINAGSVFIGPYTPESAGDYASGTNHTLPTNGYASNSSGVSLDSFMKQITFQKISKEGLNNIGWAIQEMAAAESLTAHKNAVSVRLKNSDGVSSDD